MDGETFRGFIVTGFFFLTIAGLIAIKFDIGSSDDPLGYELIIQK